MFSKRAPWAAVWVCSVLVLAPAVRAQPQATPPAAAAPSTAAPVPPPVKEEPLGFEPDELKGTNGTAAEGLAGAWALMVKAMVGLAAVLLLIYLFLGKGLAKLTQKQSVSRAMRVVDRVGLDPKKTLYLVDVDGVRTLVGISETSMAMMVMPEPGPAAAGKTDAAPQATPGSTLPKGDA